MQFLIFFTVWPRGSHVINAKRYQCTCRQQAQDSSADPASGFRVQCRRGRQPALFALLPDPVGFISKCCCSAGDLRSLKNQRFLRNDVGQTCLPNFDNMACTSASGQTCFQRAHSQSSGQIADCNNKPEQEQQPIGTGARPMWQPPHRDSFLTR